MREILFRGKRTDNGEWETGSLVIIRDGCSDKKVFLADKMTGYHTPVIPETVGQYTGLTDQKGVRIFEGDTIWNSYDEDYGKVEWDNDMAKFIITFSTFTVDFDSVYGEELEIDGNVYDNSELLKGGI